ncbi:efflux RND transporter permease subunit [Cohnella lubricantis]|uniref:Efflux RND transporter permease subunit n=1 Tax=Cohnella lubricantis TaxID=2163172 RepID=A0A841T8K4_9BACL|nr:efflux RND transporter permease subunit [Cohnella lubricantis]MBB6677262.1 efflux RND transporter permease subunit [Cohnella lubricantis]MBP2116927.1 HAE1 family hydrophobic/amphiphilic exporter-1 [Cohnella lubricantis]
MRSIIQGAFRNKAVIAILVVMVLGLGIFSYWKLPMELLPEADNPQVTVSVIGQGYDAAAMDSLVTNPLEQAVAGVKGKTNVFSTSGDGYSQVNLNFDAKTDMKEAKEEVERAVNAVPLPERVSPPYVVQFNTSMIPVSYISLAFEEGTTDARKAQIERQVVDAFRAIDGAGDVQLAGNASPSIAVTPDIAKLEASGIPLQALYGVLQGREASASVGQTSLDGTVVNLSVDSANLEDVESLQNLPVAPGVKLSDVANVELREDKESVLRIDGQDALELIVSKAANANAVSVGKEVQKTVDRLNEEVPDAKVEVRMNTSENIVGSVNSMMREVLMGALFATIVILLFMRNIRATAVTIVSIPLSLALTLYLLDLSGISLNILTLGGVAVAVGRLVDDSIVVIENIFRRLQKEPFSIDLVIDATKEVSRAITASTLTTVAVFLPMGLLRGSLQSFLLPFALTVTYSLLSSLLVALTVIPLMSAGMLRRSRIHEHQPSKRFGSFLHWNLRHKWVPLLVALALLVGSIGTYFSMPKGAVDASGAMSVDVSLEYKPDTPADEVLANGKKLESFLMEQEGVDWVAMSMGNSADAAKYGGVQSPTLVSYMMMLAEDGDAQKLIDTMKSEQPQYPEAELTASFSSFMGGGGQSEIFVDVSGDDPERLTAAANEVIAKIKPIRDVLKVESNQEELKTVYTLQVDATQARASDIASQLQAMLNPVPIGSVTVQGQAVPVMLQPVLTPQTESDLSGLTFSTDAGPRPVSDFAEWVKEEKPTQFYHKDGKSYIRVTATVEPSQLSIVGGKITEALNDVTPPDGVQLFIGGASADQSADFASLFVMMIVSIGIVYLIMVATFKTLRAPIAILATILFVPIGAVLGLIISGITPDFTAIFGVVMLIGVVVTNAIVLIDRVKQNEERMTIREALLEAAGTRMRPILMTAIATVCAMLPLVFGTSESGSIVSQSLAIVVIGGLVVSTLLTLVIVPCLYELLFYRKSRRQRLNARLQEAEAAEQVAAGLN